MSEPIVERIDPDLEVLIERFFDNSKKDLVAMREALTSRDYETLARMGHTAKGTGYGYGFRGMGDIGMALEMAAKGVNKTDCEAQIKRLAEYLDSVQVEYGE